MENQSLHLKIRNLYEKNLCMHYVILKLSVNGDNDLKDKYKFAVDSHNKSMFVDPFPNSGFDLFVPDNTTFDTEFVSQLIDMKITTQMTYYTFDTNGNLKQENSAFLLHPRSSISKTQLMLANHTGIIDSGYRGFLIGAFRNIMSEEYIVEEHTRLLQVCHPSLCPIYVVLSNEDELSSTVRAEGGFGSTGK